MAEAPLLPTLKHVIRTIDFAEWHSELTRALTHKKVHRLYASLHLVEA